MENVGSGSGFPHHVFGIDFGLRRRIIDRVSDLVPDRRARWSCIGLVAVLIGCSDSKPAPAPRPIAPARVRVVPSTAAITQLAIGQEHTCALHADQTVSCWGSNQVGQLGIPNLERSLYPAAVPLAAGALEIAATESTTCIRRADQVAYCWGHIGEHSQTHEPSAITTGVVQLAGRCFRRGDGGVECLQENAQVVPIAGVTDATFVASAGDRGCAVRGGGRVTCWVADGMRDLPVSDIIEVIVDASGMCTLAKTGDVHCYATDAPLDGAIEHTAARGLISGGAGAETCVRTESNIECWTNGTTKRRTLHLPPTSPIAFGLHSCFVKSGRDVRCWGSMIAGQLGNGWWERRPLPTRVPGVEGGVEIGGSRATPCVRHADNTMSCWGNIVVDGAPTVRRVALENVRAVPSGDFLRAIDSRNRLHEASYDDVSTTGSIATFKVKETDVATASDQCFVTTSGRMRCWQEALTPEITDAAEVVSFSEQGSTCMRHRDGRVGCFNQGSDYEQPTVIDDAIALAVAEYAQCAIRADHSLWCWGSTASQIFSPRPEPVDVAPAKVPVGEVVAMAMVRDVICVVKKTGAVACWGDNEQGQLGDGTFMPRPRPADVIGISDAIDVHVGLGFACALHRTGQVSCWGSTTSGQIGTYATSNVVDPTPVIWP